jgi:cell shape-determining protein MreC
MSEPAESVVQELLAETRRLRVENERLRQELEDRERVASGPDPRLGRLEEENRRLRQELAAATAARENLEEAVSAVLDRLERQ